MSIRFGIIGVGRLGNRHADNLVKLPEAEISAIYDIDPHQMELFLEKHPGVQVCHSAEELAGAAAVDAVLVATPTYCHKEGILAAMKFSKPVFSEKPLCRTHQELEELKPLLRAYKNVFCVGFCRRYTKSARTFKKCLEEGKIGRPLCAAVNCTYGQFNREWGNWFCDYEKSGGTQLDMLAHHYDLMNWFLGKPRTVYARALMLDRQEKKPCDYVTATVTCAPDIPCNLECSWLRSGPSALYLTVYGDKGAMRLTDDLGVEFFSPGNSRPEVLDCEDALSEIPADVAAMNMYAVEIYVFMQAIKNHCQTWTDAEAAIEAMEFSLAMMDSSETGKIVSL